MAMYISFISFLSTKEDIEKKYRKNIFRKILQRVDNMREFRKFNDRRVQHRFQIIKRKFKIAKRKQKFCIFHDEHD